MPNTNNDNGLTSTITAFKSTQLLTGISHEIRTPLTAILTLTDALTYGVYGDIPEQQQTCLDTIRNSGEELLRLLSNVIELSRADCQRNSVDLSSILTVSLLDQCFSLVQETAHKKRIRLQQDIDENVHFIQVDTLRLKQVLIKLLLDAIKWSAPQTTLYFVLTGNKSKQHITIELKGIAQGLVEAYEQNLLSGQAAMKIPMPVDEFMHAQLLKSVIEAHGGNILLQKIDNAWQTRIELPWHTASQITPPKNDEELAKVLMKQTVTNSPLILLAEDDPANLRIFSDILLAKGYQVKSVFTGLEAVIQAQQVSPDLILMDIQMPDLDGISAAQQLRVGHNTQNIPIVLFTAQMLEATEQQSLELLADAFLQKPFKINALLETLARLLPKFNQNSA